MEPKERTGVVRGGQGRSARSVADDGIGAMVVVALCMGALAVLAAIARAGGAS